MNMGYSFRVDLDEIIIARILGQQDINQAL